jgi:hypothetical protein
MPQMSSSPWFVFCLAALAVWRVTHLLQAEDGPFDLFFHLRRWLGTSLLGKLLDCFYCLSVWVAAPAAWMVGRDWPERLLLWLALSAAAILLECLHAGVLAWLPAPSLPAIYSEDPPPGGGEDELLRK